MSEDVLSAKISFKKGKKKMSPETFLLILLQGKEKREREKKKKGEKNGNEGVV